jgi:hypothetical protein
MATGSHRGDIYVAISYSILFWLRTARCLAQHLIVRLRVSEDDDEERRAEPKDDGDAS